MLKRRNLFILVAILALFVIIKLIIGWQAQSTTNQAIPTVARQVTVQELGDQQTAGLEIKIVGVVQAESSLDVRALNSGTLHLAHWSVGDQVQAGQVLARVSNDQLAISASNAQVSLSNSQANAQIMEQLAGERVAQAKLGLASAAENVKSAELALATAQNNLQNNQQLQEQSLADSRQQAVVGFANYLNVADSAMSQVNYIIRAEGNNQLPGLAEVLAVKNSQTLIKARNFYSQSQAALAQLKQAPVTTNNLSIRFTAAADLLSKIKQMVDATLEALNASITGPSFSQASLSAQTTAFANLRSSVIASQTALDKTRQALSSLELNNQSNLDNLQSAVDNAANRLQVAQIAYDNAESAVTSAQQSWQQQQTANQASLSGVQGQLNLLNSQLADLTLTAPLSGKIISWPAEDGSQVSAGAVIATVATDSQVKVIVNLSPEEAARIQIGQSAILADKFSAQVSWINPVVDPQTKKITAEIIYDNQANDLLVGSFVDVSLTVPLDRLPRTSENSLFVPLKAVNIGQQTSFVFLAQDGQAVKQQVTTGQVYGDLVEIVDGLQPGQQLIVAGNKNLEDGEAITSK